MKAVKKYLKNYRSKKILSVLKKLNPDKTQTNSEKDAIKAFKRATRLVPAYREIIKKAGIDPLTINTIENFKHNIPVLNKSMVFPEYEIHKWITGGTINDVKQVSCSSGYSGNPSFGLGTIKDPERIVNSVDFSLEYLFKISERKTFLINCFPMGVKIYTSMPIAEISVRSDVAMAIIKKVSGYYDQTIILGDPHFIKHLIEEGCRQKINWSKLNISFGVGQDWFSESMREYMEHLSGIETKPGANRMVCATMGASELDLNLFLESPYTIAIRKLAQKNQSFRNILFGDTVKAVPVFFHYFPQRIYLESIGDENKNNELVFTMLGSQLLIPLIRYNIGDLGRAFTYSEVKKILMETSYSEFIPDIKLPMVAVGGRSNMFVEKNGIKVLPSDIKQGLYENFEAAGKTTGYFRLSKKENDVLLEIQLCEGFNPDKDLQKIYESCTQKYVDTNIKVVLYKYIDFPYGVELNFEKKFKNV